MELALLSSLFIIGYLADLLVTGKELGTKQLVPSLKFRIGQYGVHLHHWLGLLLLVAALPFFGLYNGYVTSFLLGMIAHSLTLGDTISFVKKIERASDHSW